MSEPFQKKAREIRDKLLKDAGCTTVMPLILGYSSFDIIKEYFNNKGMKFNMEITSEGNIYIPEIPCLFLR
jgi:hypothetical protein